jgi:hypothetical protein
MNRFRLLLLSSVAGIVFAGAALAMPGGASAGNGPSLCKDIKPGEIISDTAQNVGHSGDYNPGNAHNPAPPFVPFGLGCNPKAF